MPEEPVGALSPDGAGDDSPAVGPYRLIREIGRGGQGIVWEAHDRRLDRRVALKVQSAWASLPAEALARFQREARVTARIDHPGVCPVYDTGLDEGGPYIAMELLEGETLSARLARATGAASGDGRPETRTGSGAGLPDTGWILGVIEAVARALHAAHAAGIVHRDLKPGNIMITPGDRPVILDFGLARAEAADLPALTATGDVFGTPAYMSPEQIHGRPAEIDARTDIWSLGVCLHEALTGGRPFEAPTREALYREILLRDPPDPRAGRPGLSKDLVAILGRAMEKDPCRRYTTALGFAEDLARAREGRPVVALRVGPVGRAWRWARRRRAAAALVAVLAIAIPALTGLGAFALGNRGDLARQRERERLAEVERHLSSAFLALYEKDHGTALSRFHEVLDLEPGSWEARAGMALVFAGIGEAAKALEALEGPGASAPEPAGIRLMRARVQRSLGGAAESWREAQALNASVEPMDHFLRASNSAAAAGDDSDSARRRPIAEQALAALESAPTARRIYHFTCAFLALQEADQGLQRRLAAALTALWPDDAEAWRLSAYLRRVWDPDRAIADARKACEMNPESPKPRLTLAEILSGAGRHDDAAAICMEAGRSAPDDARIPFLLSHIHRKAGRLEEAIAAGRKAVALDPDDPRRRAVLVEALLEAGESVEAVEQARQVAREGPRRLMSHFLLGKAETLAGNAEAAIASYRRALEINPNYEEVAFKLAFLLDERGDVEGASSVFQAVTAADPGSAVAWFNLGLARYRLGQDEGAADAWSRAVKLAPDHAAAWDGLGHARKRQRRFEEAAEAFGKAAALRPEHAEFQCNLGHALRELGRYAEALERLRRGHELGTTQAAWRYPSQSWINHCQRLATLDAGLDEALRTASASTDAAELERMALVCRARRRFDDEVSVLRRLLSGDPTTAGRPQVSRLRAAEAAVRAAGARSDARTDGTDDAAGRLRQDALRWAGEEYERIESAQDDGDGAGERVARRCAHWLESPDLAPVRDGEAFERLSLTEQVAWGRIWADFRRLRAEPR